METSILKYFHLCKLQFSNSPTQYGKSAQSKLIQKDRYGESKYDDKNYLKKVGQRVGHGLPHRLAIFSRRPIDISGRVITVIRRAASRQLHRPSE